MMKSHWVDADQTIIRVDYIGQVASWNEYNAATDDSYTLARAKNHPVYIIHNPGSIKMPPGNPMQHLRRAVQRLPHNVELIVMVVQNARALILMEMVTRWVVSNKARLVSSLADAETLIKSHKAANQVAQAK